MATFLFLAALLSGAGVFASPVPSEAPAKQTGYPVIVGENGYTSAPYHGPYTGAPTTTLYETET